MIRAVTIAKLAEETGFPPGTIRKFLQLGCPHLRPGKSIYIRPDQFEAWLLTCETTTFTPHKAAQEIQVDESEGLA